MVGNMAKLTPTPSKAPGGWEGTAGHPLCGFSPIAAMTWTHTHSRQTSCGSARSRPLFSHERPNDAGQVGGKVFATQKKPSSIDCDVQNHGKSAPNPPKSSPGASQIGPGALQDAIFKRHLIQEGPRGLVQKFSGPEIANLASTWRPKTLRNRSPNPQKSMLKNNLFLASILEGFGRRFGKVFGRFFRSKMKAKTETLNCVKS